MVYDTYSASIKVFGTEIPMSVRASEVSVEGGSIYSYDPKGKAAFAYKMKLDAMKRTAGRPTKENACHNGTHLRSDQELALQVGDSARSIQRYIRLTELIPDLLECIDNKRIGLVIAVDLAFTATLRIGELLGLTWDEMDISEEAIAGNRAYIIINKQVERVSKDAVEALNSKEIILTFPSQKKNNKTVRVLKTPKTESSARKVFIPRSVAQYLIELKQEQDEIKAALGNEYHDYNLVMATTFGLPIGDSYLRNKMQDIIDELGLPDVVFHSLRHTSVTYKLKLSGGDIKAVQGDSGHAQADMVTEVYGHIIDEDRRKMQR